MDLDVGCFDEAVGLSHLVDRAPDEWVCEEGSTAGTLIWLQITPLLKPAFRINRRAAWPGVEDGGFGFGPQRHGFDHRWLLVIW